MTLAEQSLLEGRLPHSARTGMEKAREHALSERTNDAAVILPTVSSWDSNFVILSAPADGEFLLETWLDPDAVTDFYTSRILNRHHTLAQYCMSEVNSAWFQFTEQWGDLHWFATDSLKTVHVAGLFPVWTDGILGEICWHEPTWSHRLFGQSEQTALSLQLDAFDDGWRAGDPDAKLATVQEDTRSLIRIVDVTGPGRYRATAETKDQLRNAWAAPEAGRILELERLHQSMQSWYVFASYRSLVQLRDRRVVRESALLMPVGPDGKFIGELSYSMETGL